MNAWSLALGVVVTFFATYIGVSFAADKKVRAPQISRFMTPIWIFIIEIVIVVAVSYFLYNGFWTICGIWIIGGYILGYSVESIVWKVSSKEKTEQWIKELCKLNPHQWGDWQSTDSIHYKVRKCNRCGVEEREDTGEHLWEEWKAGEKSCRQVRVCAICRQEEDKYDHDFLIVDQWIDHTDYPKYRDKSPTGQQYQITLWKCKRCGEEKKDVKTGYFHGSDSADW